MQRLFDMVNSTVFYVDYVEEKIIISICYQIRDDLKNIRNNGKEKINLKS